MCPRGTTTTMSVLGLRFPETTPATRQLLRLKHSSTSEIFRLCVHHPIIKVFACTYRKGNIIFEDYQEVAPSRVLSCPSETANEDNVEEKENFG